LHGVHNPVDARVAAHSLVHRIDANDLVPRERRVRVQPVRVQHAQVTKALAHALLRDGPVVLVQLQPRDAAVLRFAECDALVHNALAAAAAHADAEDGKPLLRLVAQHVRFLRARRALHAHHRVLVAVFPGADALHEAHHVGALLLPQLVHVHEDAHGSALLG